MLAVYLLEFTLIPYTIFVGKEELISDKNWVIELVIDVLHIVNMIVFFCTAHKGDGTGPSTDYKVIALAYIK